MGCKLYRVNCRYNWDLGKRECDPHVVCDPGSVDTGVYQSHNPSAHVNRSLEINPVAGISTDVIPDVIDKIIDAAELGNIEAQKDVEKLIALEQIKVVNPSTFGVPTILDTLLIPDTPPITMTTTVTKRDDKNWIQQIKNQITLLIQKIINLLSRKT